MLKFLILLIILITANTQELLPKKFAVLVMKSVFFNKEKANKYFVVTNDPNKARADEVNGFLGGKVFTVSSCPGSIEYVNLIFVGLNNSEISQVRTKFKKALTISDNTDNIQNVSVCFGMKDASKPKIIVNLAKAKEEADFKAQFLKIAEIIQ